MYNNFNSDHRYDFSKDDLDFILSLAKIGYVHLLSNQVSFMDNNVGQNTHHTFAFKNYSINGNGCDGLKLPENWAIEFISSTENRLTITFAIDNKTKQSNTTV